MLNKVSPDVRFSVKMQTSQAVAHHVPKATLAEQNGRDWPFPRARLRLQCCVGMITRSPLPNNNRLNGLPTQEENALRKAAAQFGFEFKRYNFDMPDDLESTFAAALRDNVSAFYISGAPSMFVNMSRVISLVAASGKPSFGPYPDWGRAGRTNPSPK